MSYISDYAVNQGIAKITKAAVAAFGSEATQRQVEQQRDVFEGSRDITNVLDADQIKAQQDGKPFVANMERAKDHGNHLLEFGVGNRLKGVYALYQAGDEMECIRYIILILDSICHALGWNKASAYLNEQNHILFKMKKAEEAA